MMCAALLSEKNIPVTLLEHNEKFGKKVFITGKGRCNFTNDCDEETFLRNVVTNPKFLYSAIYTLDSEATIRLFEKWGMKTKVERGRRAFPLSDHAFDVTDTLTKVMRRHHVDVRLKTDVKKILTDEDGAVSGVRIEHAGRTEDLKSRRVVLATGGLSYPSTGSTGDGMKFAREMGLSVKDCLPSLVPVNCREEYCKEMQGLSLKNVELKIRRGKKTVFDEFGEMMFTHFGVTGPLILTASAEIGPMIGKADLSSEIDLKPAVSEEQFENRLIRLVEKNANKELKNVLHELYPAKMVPVIPLAAQVDESTKLHDLTKEERKRLVTATKHFPITLTSLRGYNEAVITKGGLSVKEIDPGTMAVKKVPGLYAVGELIDVDALTGGYNLQIAWSTAAVCAEAIAAKESK